MQRWILCGAAAAVLAGLTAGCGSSGSNGGNAATSGAGAEVGQPAARGSAQPSSLADGSAVEVANALHLPTLAPSVIRTAQLRLVVAHDRFGGTVQRADDVAGALGGYVLTSDFAGGRPQSATVTIRVPAGNFTTALDRLSGLGKVRSRSIQGREVGQQFVDLTARLRNLRSQELVLRRLMDRAQDVTDTIRVETTLSAVQGTIERLQGQLRYLRDQTALSTIEVDMTEIGAAPPGKPGELRTAWNRAGDAALSVVTSLIVAAGFLLPLGLLGGLALFAGLRVWPRIAALPRSQRPAE
ncbi:MAG: DUF4349 domain-containing protein [Gaiellales bacterium]